MSKRPDRPYRVVGRSTGYLKNRQHPAMDRVMESRLSAVAHAGQPQGFGRSWFQFYSVDRCFAALGRFVGFIAVVVCAWLG